MEYKKPEIKAVELSAEDIICTSESLATLSYGSENHTGVELGMVDATTIFK